MATYTPINLPEMQELLKVEKGWVLVEPPGAECYFDFIPKKLAALQRPPIKNLKASVKPQQEVTAITIRVYSTIVHGASRSCGTDAIRVCIVAAITNKDAGILKGIQSFKRVHRTQNWRENLTARVTEAYDWANNNIRFCPDCGSVLTVRLSNQGKQFFGCIQYPQCKHTESMRK